MKVSRITVLQCLVALVAAAPLTANAPAAAAAASERVVRVVLDGRPIAKPGVVVAVVRHGVVFCDLIALTRAFAGLVTLNGSSVQASVGPTTATFTAGTKSLVLGDGSTVMMPGAPFLRAGTLFVPLQTFVRRIAQANVTIDAQSRVASIRAPLPQ